MSTTTPEPDPQPVTPGNPGAPVVPEPDVDHDAPDHDGDRG